MNKPSSLITLRPNLSINTDCLQAVRAGSPRHRTAPAAGYLKC